MAPMTETRAPERLGVTRGRPVIAAEAAIQESPGREQVATVTCSASSDGGAVLESGNAPFWIAAFAVMTKGVCAPIIVIPANAGI